MIVCDGPCKPRFSNLLDLQRSWTVLLVVLVSFLMHLLIVQAAELDDSKWSSAPFISNPSSGCDPTWGSWPSVQDHGLINSQVIVFTVFPRVGNLFIALHDIIEISFNLGIAIVLDRSGFEGFKLALSTNEIRWDVDPAPFMKEVAAVKGGEDMEGERHALLFPDGAMLLNSTQLARIAEATGTESGGVALADAVNRRVRYMRHLIPRIYQSQSIQWQKLQPCVWNMFFERSPNLVQTLVNLKPFPATSTSHAAWHIRTADGETRLSFNHNRHPYVFVETPEQVISSYSNAMAYAASVCSANRNTPVYLSTNSPAMKAETSNQPWNVSFIDLHLAPEDHHTYFTRDKKKAELAALTDFFFLLDSTFILRPRSSFSGMVATIKGLLCSKVPGEIESHVREGMIELCFPPSTCTL
ncbi:unnamed protein product [Choristocarpus tenellus]